MLRARVDDVDFAGGTVLLREKKKARVTQGGRPAVPPAGAGVTIALAVPRHSPVGFVAVGSNAPR